MNSTASAHSSDSLNPITGLWRNRTLLWQFTLRTVEVRHKGSHLGLVWSFLNPLLLLALYFFIFGYINKGTFGIRPDETRAEYALGIFLGLALYQGVAEILGVAPGLITSNPSFVKKVVFPLEVLPAAQVGATLFHMFISFSFALIGIAVFGPGLSWNALWIPVVLIPVVLISLGTAWAFAAIGVFFRDIGQLMQFLTLSLMFSSGVFYSAASLPAPAWAFLRFNPILLAIELLRDAALWQRPVNLYHLGYLYAVGLVSCCVSFLFFRRMKPAFADAV